MPWKKYSVSEARMRFVLAIKSKSAAFASVCARFGISRKSGYKWWQHLIGLLYEQDLAGMRPASIARHP